MHQPIEQRLNHPADFRVKYRFYTPAEGGRSSMPHQGYRSDFWYDHREHQPNYLFMIWPEFEGEKEEVILHKESPVHEKRTARMWIINKETRAYHRNKIQVGLKGYFMEGFRKVAECEVIELLGLHTNPIE